MTNLKNLKRGILCVGIFGLALMLLAGNGFAQALFVTVNCLECPLISGIWRWDMPTAR